MHGELTDKVQLRHEITLECTKAAVACWERYSDKPLTKLECDNLWRWVDYVLPKEIETVEWQQGVVDYQSHISKMIKGTEICKK